MALVDVIQFRFVPTGSLAIEFKAPDVEAITAVSVSLIDSEANETVFDDLEIMPGSYDDSYALTLLPPVPYGETYEVVATFNDEEHTDTLTLPMPTFSRTAIIRQRLFELLLPLETEEIEVYGAIHTPMSVANDFKPQAGVVIEVGVASLGSSQIDAHDSLESVVNVPISVYAAAGHPDSGARVAEAMEYVWGYLQVTDWRLSHMGVQRERATYSGQDAEVDVDRRLATQRGTVSIPLPVNLTT